MSDRFLFESRADGVRARRRVARTDVDLFGGAMVVAVVINAVYDVARDALVRSARLAGRVVGFRSIVFHKIGILSTYAFAVCLI